MVRTVRLMEVLASEPQSAPELAARLGIHPRTARRLLHRLEDEGYVKSGWRGARHRYRMTMRLVALAAQIVERAEWVNVVEPAISRLREAVGGVCYLAVPSHVSVLCLIRTAGDPDPGCHPHLRELAPSHCTAAGKALLAWRDPWRDAVLTQVLPALTDHTVTGPQWLERELRRTVERGYSTEDRELDERTRGIGAPVFSADGEAVAAVAVVAPCSLMPTERYDEVARAVRGYADELKGTIP